MYLYFLVYSDHPHSKNSFLVHDSTCISIYGTVMTEKFPTCVLAWYFSSVFVMKLPYAGPYVPCSRGAIVSIIVCKVCAKILTHTHNFIDRAHSSPDNDRFTMPFKLDTTVSMRLWCYLAVEHQKTY